MPEPLVSLSLSLSLILLTLIRIHSSLEAGSVFQALDGLQTRSFPPGRGKVRKWSLDLWTQMMASQVEKGGKEAGSLEEQEEDEWKPVVYHLVRHLIRLEGVFLAK